MYVPGFFPVDQRYIFCTPEHFGDVIDMQVHIWSLCAQGVARIRQQFECPDDWFRADRGRAWSWVSPWLDSFPNAGQPFLSTHPRLRDQIQGIEWAGTLSGWSSHSGQPRAPALFLRTRTCCILSGKAWSVTPPEHASGELIEHRYLWEGASRKRED